MIDAGRLRERITIRRQVDAINGLGEPDRSWQTIADNVAAEILCLNGREAVIGAALQGISIFQLTTRYRTDIKVSDQVLWNGRELNITAPPEDRTGTRQWTVMLADTQSPQGA